MIWYYVFITLTPFSEKPPPIMSLTPPLLFTRLAAPKVRELSKSANKNGFLDLRHVRNKKLFFTFVTLELIWSLFKTRPKGVLTSAAAVVPWVWGDTINCKRRVGESCSFTYAIIYQTVKWILLTSNSNSSQKWYYRANRVYYCRPELNAWPTVKILYIFEGVQNFCHFSFRQHENEKA